MPHKGQGHVPIVLLDQPSRPHQWGQGQGIPPEGQELRAGVAPNCALKVVLYEARMLMLAVHALVQLSLFSV